MPDDFDQLVYRLQSPCGIGAPSDHDTMAEASGVIQNMRAALSELSAVYTSCFDLVDGGLIILQGSVERFEKANEAARKALGFNDVSFDEDED